MGQAKRRRLRAAGSHAALGQQDDLITVLPAGMTGGLPARYRPKCVALFLFLAPLGSDKKRGFFANIDSDSLARFWALWPEIAIKSGKTAGMDGSAIDASIMTGSMLQASLKAEHYQQAEPRAMLAQTALWLFAERFAGHDERQLMLRGDVAVSMTLRETSDTLFDIDTAFTDLVADKTS